MLTTGTDTGAAFTGGTGNDTFNAPVGLIWDTGTTAMVEVDSMQSVDVLDGGAGVNTLNFTTAGTVALPTLKNIQVINGESLAGLTIDTSAVAGVTNLNVTKAAAAVSATGAATTDINVTMVSAANDVTALGGNNITVKVADVAGDSSAKKVTVGDTVAGGAVNAPKGDVVVEVAAKAATDGTAIKLNSIEVTGGKTISVTQKVGSASGLAAGETAPDHTQGDVTIVAGATTTTVTVKQDLAATANDAVAAVAGVNEVVSAKFVGLAATETMELTDGVNTLVFTASKTLNAAQVAAAFANLSADAAKPTGAAGDTQGSQTAANGVFTGELAGWNSGAASADTVIFTAKTAGTTGLADAGGSKSATLTTTTAAVTAVDAEAAVLGVVVGVVDITDGAALATVSVDSYSGASQIQSANTALATVNLSNGAGFDIASAAATLALNLTNVTGTVDVAAGTTTLNATVTTSKTTQATLSSATATTVNVSGTGLVGGTTTALSAATAINTTGMTAGTATFTIADGTATTYTGGAAKDIVTVTNGGTAITKAIDLGAGDDTLKLDGTVAVPTATLKGGLGTDTLSMTVASAAALDGNTLFKAQLDSFERLTLNNKANMAGDTVIDLENLGFTNYVTTSGSQTTDSLLTLDKMASGGTVVLTDVVVAKGIAVAVKDAGEDGHDTDVLNVIARVSTADITHGLLTVADVETINIKAEDTSTTVAINTSTLTLKADTVTTVNVNGNAHLILNLNGATTELATVNAADLTGNLTFTANGVVAMTITGGSGADTLTASTGADAKVDVLIGGAGNDTLVAGSNSAKLTGGAGNDIFVLTADDVDTGTKASNSYSIINDFTAGDVLQLGWWDITGSATAAASSFNKLVTDLNEETANFDSFMSAAMGQIKAANEADVGVGFGGTSGTDDALGKAVYFNFGGHAYVVVDSGVSTTGAFTGTEDLVIRLAGVNSDNLSFNSDYGSVALI